ncbi:hypothetical protein GWI33_011740 [Rhynchophorus ferrugineus]|uniref:Uncharacterized protein n=1 Tax=Rhynchophorus ferrugineus TaxID=354439 RepID=A0A834I9B7_RHYFE|nr:hypothetical protein GWI33_011740 [Rhynchophorus ferrugineus]
MDDAAANCRFRMGQNGVLIFARWTAAFNARSYPGTWHCTFTRSSSRTANPPFRSNIIVSVSFGMDARYSALFVWLEALIRNVINATGKGG